MRRAVITGACGGIGQAAVRAFTADGWQVLAIDRNNPPPDLGCDDFLELDITDPASLDVIEGRLASNSLEALVNNAAVSHDAPMADTGPTAFDAVIASNLRAPFQLTARLRVHLAKGSGAVVNVASVHALATSVNVSAYAASKGGLVSFTRAAALELATVGVRCNAVLPGAIDTAMLQRGLKRDAHEDGPEGKRRQLEARTPLGRVGRPEEAAQAILFLADNTRASFITGQLLIVDGGVLARLASE